LTFLDCGWDTPPAELELSSHDLDVWRASLDQPEELVARLSQTLNTEEQARAQRFHFERHRRRFTVGRAVLRWIVGYYLKIAADEVQFDYSSHGKPALAAVHHQDTFQFNLSHSQTVGLYAFTHCRKIGIDVEHDHEMKDMEGIASRFFSSREHHKLRQVPAEKRREAFFNCWTRKEAYIKAIGDGLSSPLDRFDVSLAPGDSPQLLSIDGDPQKAALWSVIAFNPVPGYAAAICVERGSYRPRFWQWEGD
jgi:4'-phosphopantetheinyl transferase